MIYSVSFKPDDLGPITPGGGPKPYRVINAAPITSTYFANRYIPEVKEWIVQNANRPGANIMLGLNVHGPATLAINTRFLGHPRVLALDMSKFDQHIRGNIVPEITKFLCRLFGPEKRKLVEFWCRFALEPVLYHNGKLHLGHLNGSGHAETSMVATSAVYLILYEAARRASSGPVPIEDWMAYGDDTVAAMGDTLDLPLFLDIIAQLGFKVTSADKHGIITYTDNPTFLGRYLNTPNGRWAMDRVRVDEITRLMKRNADPSSVFCTIVAQMLEYHKLLTPQEFEEMRSRYMNHPYLTTNSIVLPTRDQFEQLCASYEYPQHSWLPTGAMTYHQTFDLVPPEPAQYPAEVVTWWDISTFDEAVAESATARSDPTIWEDTAGGARSNGSYSRYRDTLGVTTVTFPNVSYMPPAQLPSYIPESRITNVLPVYSALLNASTTPGNLTSLRLDHLLATSSDRMARVFNQYNYWRGEVEAQVTLSVAPTSTCSLAVTPAGNIASASPAHLSNGWTTIIGSAGAQSVTYTLGHTAETTLHSCLDTMSPFSRLGPILNLTLLSPVTFLDGTTEAIKVIITARFSKIEFFLARGDVAVTARSESERIEQAERPLIPTTAPHTPLAIVSQIASSVGELRLKDVASTILPAIKPIFNGPMSDVQPPTAMMIRAPTNHFDSANGTDVAALSILRQPAQGLERLNNDSDPFDIRARLSVPSYAGLIQTTLETMSYVAVNSHYNDPTAVLAPEENVILKHFGHVSGRRMVHLLLEFPALCKWRITMFYLVGTVTPATNIGLYPAASNADVPHVELSGVGTERVVIMCNSFQEWNRTMENGEGTVLSGYATGLLGHIGIFVHDATGYVSTTPINISVFAAWDQARVAHFRPYSTIDILPPSITYLAPDAAAALGYTPAQSQSLRTWSCTDCATALDTANTVTADKNVTWPFEIQSMKQVLCTLQPAGAICFVDSSSGSTPGGFSMYAGVMTVDPCNVSAAPIAMLNAAVLPSNLTLAQGRPYNRPNLGVFLAEHAGYRTDFKVRIRATSPFDGTWTKVLITPAPPRWSGISYRGFMYGQDQPAWPTYTLTPTNPEITLEIPTHIARDYATLNDSDTRMNFMVQATLVKIAAGSEASEFSQPLDYTGTAGYTQLTIDVAVACTDTVAVTPWATNPLFEETVIFPFYNCSTLPKYPES